MKQARTSLDGGFLKILAKDAVLPRLSKIKPSRPRDAGLDSRHSSEGRGRSSQEAVESLRCETLWKSQSEGRSLEGGYWVPSTCWISWSPGGELSPLPHAPYFSRGIRATRPWGQEPQWVSPCISWYFCYLLQWPMDSYLANIASLARCESTGSL